MNAMNGQAPPGEKFRMGGKGGKGAAAWQYVWDRLSTEEFRDGKELWEEAAERYGLKPISVRATVFRMAHEGILERGKHVAGGPRGVRERATFRIKPGAVDARS